MYILYMYYYIYIYIYIYIYSLLTLSLLTLLDSTFPGLSGKFPMGLGIPPL